MKKTIALLLALLMLGAAAACTGTTPKADPTAAPTDAPAEPATPEPAGDADAEAAAKVAELIDAIYVQERTDETDAQCAAAKAVALGENVIYAIGNAPTALLRLREHIDGGYRPKCIIGVPVGFVNVVASKERIIGSPVPCIVARGRKGGSNVAACIVNALLYMLDETRGAQT